MVKAYDGLNCTTISSIVDAREYLLLGCRQV
jgi:hypothetical protein